MRLNIASRATAPAARKTIARIDFTRKMDMGLYLRLGDIILRCFSLFEMILAVKIQMATP
jgi:hypothetical protein